MQQLVLETFAGISMLGIGFKEQGFCVVSSGDTILGNHHDIRNFHAVAGKFDGVIGGSPCQNFSKLNRNPDRAKGIELMNEFKRIVIESGCSWFLLENVPESPDISIDGYAVQRFMLNAKHCGSNQNRNRKFQFGSKEGFFLHIQRDSSPINVSSCLTASEGKNTDRRTWEDFCELQGLPRDFDLPEFTLSGAYRAVGNGVNAHVSRVVAKAIREATEGNNTRLVTDFKFCICGCGETISASKTHYNASCRKRMQVRREASSVNKPGTVTRGITLTSVIVPGV